MGYNDGCFNCTKKTAKDKRLVDCSKCNSGSSNCWNWSGANNLEYERDEYLKKILFLYEEKERRTKVSNDFFKAMEDAINGIPVPDVSKEDADLFYCIMEAKKLAIHASRPDQFRHQKIM